VDTNGCITNTGSVQKAKGKFLRSAARKDLSFNQYVQSLKNQIQTVSTFKGIRRFLAYRIHNKTK